MDDSPFYEGAWLNFKTITDQADEFIAGFSDRQWLDFVVAAAILENSLRSGRPPSGRAERVEGSASGLWELKVTPPGRRGPHTRLLYVRKGRTVYVAWGLVKRERALGRRAIKLADAAVQKWCRRRRGR